MAHLFSAFAVGNAGGLDDCAVVAHVIDKADEAVVEEFDGLVEDFFQRWDGGAAGLESLFTKG